MMTIFAIFGYFLGFVLDVHIVVDLPTVVIKDIFLIEFGGIAVSALVLGWISISIVRNLLWPILVGVFLD